MRVFNVFLSTLILILIFSLSLPVVFARLLTNPIIGVRTGQWAKYIGSPPFEEYEWIHMSITNLVDNNVTIAVKFRLRYPHQMSLHPPNAPSYYPPYYEMSVGINLATGENNFGFMFLIPINLTIGDEIPLPQSLRANYTWSINGTDVREYAGVKRIVVYASSQRMSWDGPGTMYWDKDTGLLVEMVANEKGSLFSSMRLIETNIWSLSLLEILTHNFLYIFMIVGALAFLITIIFTQLKRPKSITSDIAEERESLFKNLHSRIAPNIGRILAAIGLTLFTAAALSYANYHQMFFSFGVVFGVIFSVVGLLIHTKAWEGTRYKIDIGYIMMAATVILLSIAVVFMLFRELGAEIPYKEVYVTFAGGMYKPHVLEFTNIETVYVYPYLDLVNPLATIALCLGAYGLFIKVFYGY